MLNTLSIRNVVLIDTLDAGFGAGLCALTGETGAGKSILLGALGLALGQRADRGQVRTGADEASAVAEFDLPSQHPALAPLVDAGVDVSDEDPLILRRRLTADGKSRAYINDQSASITLMRQVGERLVEIHGQHDGRGLMDVRTHLGLLDRFVRHDSKINTVKQAWKALSSAQERYDTLLAASQSSAEEEDFLRHALEEIDTLDPQSGEDAELSTERQFLMHAERALTDLQEAEQALSGDGEGLEQRLTTALRGLERVREHIGNSGGAAGEALNRAAGAIDRALIEFDEANEALSEASRAFDVEPGRLNEVEERLFALRALARKHGVDVEALDALRERFATQLDAIDHSEQRVSEAENALRAARDGYEAASNALTASRKKAAKGLVKRVMDELPDLKLDKARFQVSFETTKPGPGGVDSVRFEISTNPGSAFGPLDKIASGGELSRFSLALKVALAGEDEPGVMIFDEVDQGVGGAVADAVGRRLKRLSDQAQILVVTHSPQVAALADHHWKIQKTDGKDGQTRTTLVRLEGDHRREEVARMLSGADITDAARAQADALLSVRSGLLL